MKLRIPVQTRDPRSLSLNILIGALALLVVFLTYSLVDRHILRPPVESARQGEGASGVIQLDVLNGCGVPGSATSFRDYLRARGFDVVEMRNYRSFDVEKSLVVDRTGMRANAERVAYALGIDRSHIIQQINPDYYVDVSVVIGRDYKSLKPSQ
jgi:LytR cell envelope-related transcriptional attenuator